MADAGIDISDARPKHLDEFTDRRFDYVTTLCDQAREVSPGFPGAAGAVHWSIPDPAAGPDGRAGFDRVAAELAERIAFLLHALTRRGVR